jgi:hypothetical protein
VAMVTQAAPRPAHLQVRMATGCPAVPAVQAPLRALLLSMALLLAEADQAFTCGALGQQEWAESFVAALATKGGGFRRAHADAAGSHGMCTWLSVHVPACPPISELTLHGLHRSEGEQTQQRVLLSPLPDTRDTDSGLSRTEPMGHSTAAGLWVSAAPPLEQLNACSAGPNVSSQLRKQLVSSCEAHTAELCQRPSSPSNGVGSTECAWEMQRWCGNHCCCFWHQEPWAQSPSKSQGTSQAMVSAARPAVGCVKCTGCASEEIYSVRIGPGTTVRNGDHPGAHSFIPTT